MRRALAAVLCAAAVCGAGVLCESGRAAGWNGQRTPFDGHRLVVLRPAQAERGKDGTRAAATKDAAALFGEAVPLSEPVLLATPVRHAGTYEVWVRLAVAPPVLVPDVTYTVRQGEKVLATGTLRDPARTPEDGGPEGYVAYAKRAQQTGAIGRLDRLSDGPGDANKTAASEFEKEVLAASKPTGSSGTPTDWVHFLRLEQVDPARPRYWFRLGRVALGAGPARIELSAPAPRAAKPGAPVLAFDTAFLTTAPRLVYPYHGDLDAPPASYIRFRLDEVPTDGVRISALMRIHNDPWQTGSQALNPVGMVQAPPEPHVRPGFTPWYRLQDLPNAPGFGGAEAQLLLTVRPEPAPGSVAGATQFAPRPHDDAVVREIPWSEPDATRLSLVTDFATHPHRIRTLRDHAREHYEYARTATKDRLFPLTRGDLLFTNAWGAATGDPAQYMVKTLRLLGLNSVGDGADPVRHRELYGWQSSGGHYWPPSYLPFDEKESQTKYDAHYRDYFAKRNETYDGMNLFQIADEPGEILREEMSAPLWRFQKDAAGEKYADLAGEGILATKRTDYADVVLEGTLERHGPWIGLRVGTDRAVAPTRHADWRLGQVSIDREMNLATSKTGLSDAGTGTFKRAGIAIAPTGTPFKIVWQQDQAALYVAGRLAHQFAGLPKNGGFAIVGPRKAVRNVVVRPIRKEERLATGAPDSLGDPAAPKKPAAGDDLDDLLTGAAGTQANVKPLPLREAIAKDWTIDGGRPEAHRAFRTWCVAQGLTPTVFDAASWDDVRLLTVRELVETPADARLFYWSRRFSGELTPKMFGESARAIRAHAPNKSMQGFVALSGHSLYFPSAMPLDMFALAQQGPALVPGISDWMSFGGWRWDDHQAVAFSVAFYNSGARRHGAEPLVRPMMHCVWPSEYRGYTMLANQCRVLSYFNWGPSYAVTEGYWSDAPSSYVAVHRIDNRAAQVDDVLAASTMRPSRVALLYSRATEYWNGPACFPDKRATFLGLSHEYFQPELVTEEQIAADSLAHYDALYVLDTHVTRAAGDAIAAWVRRGGLLVTAADAARRDEYDAPRDLLAELADVRRTYDEPAANPAPGSKPTPAAPRFVQPAGPDLDFRPHAVSRQGLATKLAAPAGAKIRATYDDGSPAWIEKSLEKGRLVHLGHRPGLTYTAQAVRRGGHPVVWADTGRAPLVVPLLEAKISRELVLSEPLVVASPLSSPTGTVVVLYNLRPQPLKKVELRLREERRPARVQLFEDDRLVDVPFEHADGHVRVVLPDFASGQMVLVRREAAPADPRAADQLARTARQLAPEADWKSLAAGAWFAGFAPDERFVPRLVELLKHAHWDVRRSAAESLGRSKAKSAADALLEAIGRESDSHALGDLLVALAEVGDDRLGEATAKALSHPQPFVRRQAVRALAVRAARPEVPSYVLEQAVRAEQDADPAVVEAAIALHAKQAPDVVLAQALTADRERSAGFVPWSEALAANDSAFAQWVRDGLPGSDDLLLRTAVRRRAPELARALAERVERLPKTETGRIVSAAQVQADPTLAKTLLAKRSTLDPALVSLLPLILERTFDARIGNRFEDWDAFAAQGK